MCSTMECNITQKKINSKFDVNVKKKNKSVVNSDVNYLRTIRSTNLSFFFLNVYNF